ncbi:NIPSNAP family protein [Rhodoligotrophos defluvii]|uniref:NIPSNAP family protein n=1 Tax=Rhodoligotrophos defluvii TaxID=2561934 RepID=UPI0010C9998D|nr:NIPSNAP family protein [Rhodoligotrophos defluvii]
MIYELRRYMPVAGKEAALRDRFANGTLRLFDKLGIKVTHFWEHASVPGELWYVVAWRDEAAMKAGWEAFRNDPEWTAFKAKTEADGPLAASITSIPLKDVDFFTQSPA